MLSRNLEKSMHRALAYANERRHEYATLEHLLLALTEDQDAIAVLRACGVDLGRLRGEVPNYFDHEFGNLVSAHGDDAKPTASFQRVLQRAAIHVQSSGREEVTGANVLVAMFAERESHAVFLLQEQHMTRFDAVNYITHGIAKASGRSETRRAQEKAEPTEGMRLQKEDHTVVLGRVACVKSRARAGDYVEVTLIRQPADGPGHGSGFVEALGTYFLAEDHVDFDRLYWVLSKMAVGAHYVRLTVDEDSHVIRSIVFGRGPVYANS